MKIPILPSVCDRRRCIHLNFALRPPHLTIGRVHGAAVQRRVGGNGVEVACGGARVVVAMIDVAPVAAVQVSGLQAASLVAPARQATGAVTSARMVNASHGPDGSIAGVGMGNTQRCAEGAVAGSLPAGNKVLLSPDTANDRPAAGRATGVRNCGRTSPMKGGFACTPPRNHPARQQSNPVSRSSRRWRKVPPPAVPNFRAASRCPDCGLTPSAPGWRRSRGG